MELVPIVSFPKSGNTWLRFMLAHLVRSDKSRPVTYHNINALSPTSHIFTTTEIAKNLVPGAPVFIKEHANYYEMEKYPWERAIYVYRDGLDVLYSYWKFIDAQAPGLYKNINRFVEGYWIHCGHWGDHIMSWRKGGKSHQKVLFLKYEELLDDPISAMRNCIDFLEINASNELVEEAVKENTASRMKKLNDSASFMNAQNENFNFVRNARKGDGSRLPSDVKQKFLEYWSNDYCMLSEGYIETGDDIRNNISTQKSVNIITKMRVRLRRYFYGVKRKFIQKF